MTYFAEHDYNTVCVSKKIQMQKMKRCITNMTDCETVQHIVY